MDADTPRFTGVASPEVVDASPSALCMIGRPPLVLTGILLWVLRNHFSSALDIVDESLKSYVWTSATETTKIAIEPITKWPGDPTQALGRRPAIYVKRNSYRRAKLGIGDKYQFGSNLSVDTETGLGHTTYQRGSMYGVALEGTYTVFCIGGTGAEAESVGTEAFFELVEFAPIIRRDFDLARFEIVEMGALAKLEEAKEHWVVPINVSTVFYHDWELTQQMAIFSGVKLTTETAGG